MRAPLSLAALALSTPALAAQPAQQQVTHDGQTYTYTVRQAGDRQVIDGRGANGRFHLVVRGDSVTGTAGGFPVAFKARSGTAAVEVAAR